MAATTIPPSSTSDTAPLHHLSYPPSASAPAHAVPAQQQHEPQQHHLWWHPAQEQQHQAAAYQAAQRLAPYASPTTHTSYIARRSSSSNNSNSHIHSPGIIYSDQHVYQHRPAPAYHTPVTQYHHQQAPLPGHPPARSHHLHHGAPGVRLAPVHTPPAALGPAFPAHLPPPPPSQPPVVLGWPADPVADEDQKPVLKRLHRVRPPPITLSPAALNRTSSAQGAHYYPSPPYTAPLSSNGSFEVALPVPNFAHDQWSPHAQRPYSAPQTSFPAHVHRHSCVSPYASTRASLQPLSPTESIQLFGAGDRTGRPLYLYRTPSTISALSAPSSPAGQPASTAVKAEDLPEASSTAVQSAVQPAQTLEAASAGAPPPAAAPPAVHSPSDPSAQPPANTAAANAGWNIEQLYNLPEHIDYMSAPGDYSNLDVNVNGGLQQAVVQEGVVPAQPDHTYALPNGEDYNHVATTLSNWAEAANVVPEGIPEAIPEGADGMPLVPPPVNNGNAMADASVAPPPAAQPDVPVAPVVGEKPKKLVLACHFCRGRKLKCDGGRPTCGHCAKRSISCTYDEAVRRRGPGKRTKEMRERAAREAEAAGLGLNPEALAQLTAATSDVAAGPSGIVDGPKKAGRKRKSEQTEDEAEKKARLDEEQAVAALAAHLPPPDVPHTLEQGLHDPSLHEQGLHEQNLHEQSLHEQSLHEQSLHDPSLHDPAQQALHDQALQDQALHEQAQQALHDQSLQHDPNLDPSLQHDPNLDPSLAHDQGIVHHEQIIDPALTEGELNLGPLEPGTLGQVIQSLNGQQQ